MPPRLLIKFPTRNRPDKFRAALLRHIQFLSGTCEVRFVITLDEDDPTMNNPAMRSWLDGLDVNLRYVFGHSKSKIEAVNADLEDESTDVLLVTSDDMMPLVPGYDQVILDAFGKSFPDFCGAIRFWDGRRHPADPLMTLPVIGWPLYQAIGHAYHPDYFSVFADDEQTQICQQLGRLAMDPRCIIQHQWAAMPSEPLYARNMNQEVYQRDHGVFQRRKAAGFDLADIRAKVEAAHPAPRPAGPPSSQASPPPPRGAVQRPLHPSGKIDASAIIPCWNDDYTLFFCLESIAGVVAEVMMVNGASTDDSTGVIAWAAAKFGNIKVLNTARVGNVEARNLGMALATRDRLVFIDADDVFCGNVEELRRALENPSYFGLINLYGDLHHQEMIDGPASAARELHYDVCHLSVDRRQMPDFKWRPRTEISDKFAANSSIGLPYQPAGLLFWHLRGVKPDERLVNRHSGWWEKSRQQFNAPPKSLMETLHSVNLKRIGKKHPWYPDILKHYDRFLLQHDAAGQITGRVDLAMQPARKPLESKLTNPAPATSCKTLDLRAIPKFCLGEPFNLPVEYQTHFTVVKPVSTHGPRLPKNQTIHSRNVGQGHLDMVLKSTMTTPMATPILLHEDDAMPSQWYADALAYPADADIVWLGFTTVKDPPENGGYLHSPRVTPHDARYSQICNDRVWGCHAILLVTPNGKVAWREYALAAVREGLGIDNIASCRDARVPVKKYVLNQPCFVQKNSHEGRSSK